MTSLIYTSSLADTEVARLDPPLRHSYSIFMGNFQKNLDKILNNQVQLPNRTPLCKFEPPIQKSWIRPMLLLFILFSYSVYTWPSLYGTHVEPSCTLRMGPIWMSIYVPYRLLSGNYSLELRYQGFASMLMIEDKYCRSLTVINWFGNS